MTDLIMRLLALATDQERYVFIAGYKEGFAAAQAGLGSEKHQHMVRELHLDLLVADDQTAYLQKRLRERGRHTTCKLGPAKRKDGDDDGDQAGGGKKPRGAKGGVTVTKATPAAAHNTRSKRVAANAGGGKGRRRQASCAGSSGGGMCAVEEPVGAHVMERARDCAEGSATKKRRSKRTQDYGMAASEHAQLSSCSSMGTLLELILGVEDTARSRRK